jgi:hypothetical protein
MFITAPDSATPSDLTLSVDGNETAGDYFFQITYQAIINP